MNSYWIRCLLSFHSYIPKRLEIGQLFLDVDKEGDPYVFVLESVPKNEEEFLKNYGYPVEPYIVVIDETTDMEDVIAEPDEIGWMDEEFLEEYIDINVYHFNRILSAYGGELEIEMTDDDSVEGNIMPLLIEDRVVLRYPEDEEDEEENEEEN